MDIVCTKGDITKIKADVIVNAANTSLLGGGGVDGAIHRAGGLQILEECRQIRNKQGSCKVGEAVYTTAGNLKANYVIHTVGPKWNKGQSNEITKLMSCYENTFLIAESLQAKHIAIPNISTGIYRFPKKTASEIAFHVLRNYKFGSVEKVEFVCFDDENYNYYTSYIENELDLWEAYDPQWLEELVKTHFPDDLDLLSSVRKCNSVKKGNDKYLRFISGETPNQSESLWQFKEQLRLSSDKGEFLLDLLTENRIGGVEIY